ncbi:hypothetical protein CP533_2548 [Ophiocordyceps camponoti-saundersi (nom. inval.)]|nr:hypothetical protein CP533_2548 [Ophiocordyceps camponoti-saundersi (nom. inval.)]
MASADKDQLKSAMLSLSLQDAIDKDTKQSEAEEKEKKNKKQTKKKTEIVDSWEDDYESSSSVDDAQQPAPTATKTSKSPSSPPVSSPNVHTGPTFDRSPDVDARRPEKTDAVARRMITAGLGLRMPKPTAEQIAYQKSIREQARKRRDEQKAEEQRLQEEAEKAKAAIWND